MATKHIIRKDGTGNTRTVSLTPIKAIRFNCVECMGMQPSLVKDCPSTLCSLYPFRLGKSPRRQR